MDDTEESVSPPQVAVSSIMLSAALMALASGLTFAYIPIKLASLDFQPWVAASMTPALALGGLAGCIAVGPLLRLSGHARVFMLLYAMIIISMVIIAAVPSVVAWLFARALYGFGVNGMFIVAQSWLHDVSTDHNRGKTITTFYVSYVVALGFGAFTIRFIEIDGNLIPLIATLFVAIAMVPVGLTRLKQPAPPERVTVALRRVWHISPVGLAGMFAVGGMTMTLQSFAPIYANAEGFSKADVGLLMLLMQLGLLVIQIPMGLLSDRIDRRRVLLAVSVIASMAAGFSIYADGSYTLLWMVLVFAVWNGATETIYSVSSALANDRADPKDYVLLSSTQMIAWSISGFVVPLIATVAIQYLPLSVFMWMLVSISLCFGMFVLVRMRMTDAVEPGDREIFQTATAQVVYPGEFVHPEPSMVDPAPKPAEFGHPETTMDDLAPEPAE